MNIQTKYANKCISKVHVITSMYACVYACISICTCLRAYIHMHAHTHTGFGGAELSLVIRAELNDGGDDLGSRE